MTDDRSEAGFSLAEVLAALLIISGLVVSLTGIIQNTLASWDKTTEAVLHGRELLVTAENILIFEQGQTGDGRSLYLAFSEEDSLVLAEPKIDKGADCVFDMVGRRCR